MKITDKDWDRMFNLLLSDQNNLKISKSIKNKEKAVARFISGVKLAGKELRYDKDWKEYSCIFSAFGNRAIELGFTVLEIQELFNEIEVPEKYIEKLKRYENKKLDNRFVGALSKAILDAGFDLTFLPHNGNAITLAGKDAMDRNGRKWTIGYKIEINLGSKRIILFFDAITDEGDGPTFYVADNNNSNKVFDTISSWDPISRKAFVLSVMNILKEEY